MADIYHQRVKLLQIPFVVAWFATLIALNFFIPTYWKFTRAVSFACWWSVLAIGIRLSEKKPKEPSSPLDPSVQPLGTSVMNRELYEKALDHNREQQTVFFWLWLLGLLIAIVGVYFKMQYYQTAGFLITLGLFLTSFLLKTLSPKKHVPPA